MFLYSCPIVFVRHAFPLLANAYNIAALKTLSYTFDVHFDTVPLYSVYTIRGNVADIGKNKQYDTFSESAERVTLL